ncbi:MAG: hypothetical protein GXO47_10840 [Chlorobi bacterium]|nr:hypothetical protein [Chlorobiota bacterium]
MIFFYFKIKIRYSILLFFILFFNLGSNSQGLQFFSSKKLIKERTAYTVFANQTPEFKNYLSVSFDLSVLDPDSYGYVVYIKDEENDISYNLAYYSDNDSLSYFNLSTKSKEILLNIPINKTLWGKGKWQKIIITFDTNKDSIFVTINNNSFGVKKLILNNRIRPQIFFGKHESYIDLPKMAIRNLRITGKNKKLLFNFNENTGNIVHDINGKPWGYVENPIWLINQHYHWHLEQTLYSNEVSAICFDENKHRFVIINTDSIYFYNITQNKTIKQPLKQKSPVRLRIGMGIINEKNNRMYVYEVNDVKPGEPTIASIDLNDLKWRVHSYDQLDMQKHHHDSYFNKKTNELLIFGGYGNRRYSNEFYKIVLTDTSTSKWEKLNFAGDNIPARFFSGMATKNSNELLIYGGVGNPLGDQNVGKIYYHDCYSVNLKDSTITKLWENNDGKSFVSVRNMILPEDSGFFYTIRYPEYKSNTYLKLYKFDINDGNYKILGDSVLMVSERIRTNANLYLDKSSEQLFLVTQEFHLDGSSRMKFYSILFPPSSTEDFFTENDNNSEINTLKYLSIILIFLVSLFIIVKLKTKHPKIKHNGSKTPLTLSDQQHNRQKKNAMYLFGDFIVYDNNGNEISYRFSPKLKQMFLTLFFNTVEGGITSKEVCQVLWPDKTPNRVKNIKGVTLNKLRKILIDIDGVELRYENNKYMLKLSDNFYSDYLEFEKLITDISKEENIKRITEIVSKGKFLSFTDFYYFDSFKNSIEDEAFNNILIHLNNFYKNKDYLNVILLSKIIYYMDALNEISLHYELASYFKLNMEKEARKRFNEYIIEYHKVYNDNYKYTFSDLKNGEAQKTIKDIF